MRASVVALLWLGLAAPTMAGVDTCRPAAMLQYDVTLDNEPIGSHRIRFERDGDMLEMEAVSDIRVERLLFTVYRRDYRSRERWRGDRLQSVETSLIENGEHKARRVVRGKDGLEGLQGGGGEVFPASYWSFATVRQARLFDTTDGRVLAVTIRDAGAATVATAGGPVSGRRYLIDGELQLELWYDNEGCWLKMRSMERGRHVEFTRR